MTPPLLEFSLLSEVLAGLGEPNVLPGVLVRQVGGSQPESERWQSEQSWWGS